MHLPLFSLFVPFCMVVGVLSSVAHVKFTALHTHNKEETGHSFTQVNRYSLYIHHIFFSILGTRESRLCTLSVMSAELTSSGLRKDSILYIAVEQFRHNFRQKQIPENYSVYQHFGLINIVGVTWIILACWFGDGPMTWFQSFSSPLCMILFGFSLCNYFEWYTHRYNLHHPFKHTRHSHVHHRFFTGHTANTNTYEATPPTPPAEAEAMDDHLPRQG